MSNGELIKSQDVLMSAFNRNSSKGSKLTDELKDSLIDDKVLKKNKSVLNSKIINNFKEMKTIFGKMSFKQFDDKLIKEKIKKSLVEYNRVNSTYINLNEINLQVTDLKSKIKEIQKSLNKCKSREKKLLKNIATFSTQCEIIKKKLINIDHQKYLKKVHIVNKDNNYMINNDDLDNSSVIESVVLEKQSNKFFIIFF